MKKMWKKALASILTLAMVASSFTGFATEVQAAEDGKVTATVQGDSVVIGNDYISREFSTAGDKVSTVEITNKRTDNGDTVFTPAEGSEEFIIRMTKEESEPVVLEAMDRTGWTATADSYQNASGPSDGPASNLLDGNVDSIWHTNYGGGTGSQVYPYNVIITLNGEKTFKCFSYTPRTQGEATNGNIKGYELWASNATETLAADADGWTKIASGNFEYNGVNPIYVNLAEECTATQLKFVATSANNGASFAGGAEFNLHADAAPVDTNDREFAASELELAGEPVVEDTTATINSVEKTGKKITFSFKPYTFKDVEWTISEVIVMYDGDHFMRKYMEISVPEDQKATAEIDYIDLESLKVNDTDATWTIPTDAGGVVKMDQFKANLGQPIYIQGMFFGCEFPETDTQIVEGTGYMRYYTGKNFERFEADNQLTTDGKYVTWQTVAGAARSTEQQVIQADFFEYIYSIATPSDFRIQYNSWFDNMMRIDDANILETFIEFDREMNNVEVRPLDSYVVDDGWNNYNDTYVVDSVRSGTTLNQTGFWEFNSKFPEGLTPSSELVHKFGSNFGVWVGPRGGYNFYGSIADILTKSGKGSKAGGSIDVADREYVKNFQEMAVKWQQDYGVNYWKWDGFADNAQYGAFAAADGVPGYANRHMTGGYKAMYHVTDLWEAWIDLMEACRVSEKEDGIKNLWISLTCYTNPSPWFLQWANSVWMQMIYDQKDASFGTTKMNKQLTYRDAMYYDFLVNHEFQFPIAYVYNHDPVYGTEGTGMNKKTATDEDFQNYLYMQSTRGVAFWELYFSDSIMTDDKYEVTSEYLAWAEENFHILRNAKFIGNAPDGEKLGGGSSSEAYANAYGFSCFDGKDGIISLRNPSAANEKTITITFDRKIGVPEDAGTLKYHLEHTYNLTEGTDATGELTYGQEYSFTLQPNEVRILRVSADGDTTAPQMVRAYSDGDKVVTVKFDEKVTGTEFAVAGATVESVEASADDITFRITLTEALADGAAVEVTATDIEDKAGNACEGSISFVHNTGNVVANGAVEAADSLSGNNGFTVAATVETATAGTVVAQGDAYALGINEDGYATFTLNGTTAVSDTAVVDGDTIVGVKENNGILKLYVNGTLAGAAYNEENRYYEVAPAAITVNNATAVKVADKAFGYDTVADVYTAGGEVEEDLQITEGLTATASGSVDEEASNVENIFDGDPTTYWNSNSVAAVEAGNPNLVVDLGETYTINRIDYSPRYFNGPANYWWCTGNIKKLVLEVSTDGETWTAVTPEGGLDISDKIVNTADTSLFPIAVEFEGTEAKYVRISGTESYHWNEANLNTSITIGDIAIYKVPTAKPEELPLDAIVATTAGNEELNGGDAEGPAGLATDGDEGTKWHTDWFPEDGNTYDDHWLQLELDAVYAVSGFKYLPRQDSSSNGDITGYQIQVSMDGVNWTTAAEGTWESGKDWKEVTFEAQNAKYVRLQATSSLGDQPTKHFSAAAEVRVVGIKTDAEVPTTPVVVDKAELEAAIAAAEALNAEDYTEESWAAAAAALEEAKLVYEAEEATQEEVDAAAAELNAVVEALEEKPVDPPVVPEEDEVVRISGTTRYETGYKVADALKEELGVEKFDAVVVATGKNFADALAGSYLAVQKNAPIILTNGKDDNVAQLHEYITANVAAGGKVYILGGEAAVPATVEAIDGYDVVRLSGKSRYETNLAILAEAGIEGTELIVATGKTFADSLSASAAKLPILLVKPGAALSDEAKAIAEGMSKFYIIGGEGAVSADIAAELAAYGEVVRVSGKTRYETSVAVANTFFADIETVVVASGKNFPDGLCGGPLAAAMNAPLILTADAKTEAAADYVAANAVASGFVLGGTGALADESVVDVFALESADEIVLK